VKLLAAPARWISYAGFPMDKFWGNAVAFIKFVAISGREELWETTCGH